MTTFSFQIQLGACTLQPWEKILLVISDYILFPNLVGRLFFLGKEKEGCFPIIGQTLNFEAKLPLKKSNKALKKPYMMGKWEFCFYQISFTIVIGKVLYVCHSFLIDFGFYFSQRNPWHSKCSDHHGKVRILLLSSIL